jgi:membrane protease YdiL (CAAX protease family)
MSDGPLPTTRDATEAGVALDTKRLVVAWLLGGLVPFCLWYVQYRVAPLTVEYGPFVTAFVDVCAVLFFLWRWPRVFGLSRLRPGVSDFVVGALVGYLCTNVSVSLPAMGEWPWILQVSAFCPRHRTMLFLKLLFVCHVLVMPAAEELIFRGMILGSLCKRTSVLWAVLITAAAAAVLHAGPYAFVPQLFLCGAYLARHRSIPASITAHAVTNALVWWPNLVVAGHFLK